MVQMTLVRNTTNRLNTDITRRKLRSLAEEVSECQVLGYKVQVGRLDEPTQTFEGATVGWRYEVPMTLRKEGATEAHVEKLEHLVASLTRQANKMGWEVIRGPEAQPEGSQTPLPPFQPPELSEEVYLQAFAGVYERDAHIRTIHAAVQSCARTGGEALSHVLLYGLPGACKSRLMDCFKRWYEADGSVERVSMVDGTTMTKAGLETWLLDLAERNRLPDVLVVDELEKQPMDNLLCLNNIMGSGVLTRCNARQGHIRKKVGFVVVGICNDEEALRAFRGGSLWSRFTHKLRCVRPSRPLCRLILTELADDPAWVDVALQFGWDQLGQRDIREIRGHLDGRERLLDGSWQRDQLEMAEAARKEDAERGLA